MKKHRSVNAKIVLHLDSSNIRIDPLALNWGDFTASLTCLVFFSESEDIIEFYSESSAISAGSKVHEALIQMIDSNNPSLFGFQVFNSNPMILATDIEEALNRPQYFERFVLHIVLTDEPIQSFLDIRDLSNWKKRFLSEVKKQLISVKSQMHGLIPSSENPVTSPYELKTDTAFLCIISLYRYLHRSKIPEYNDINFLNLLLHLSLEKNPDQFCTQEFSELCLNYARYLQSATAELEDFYKVSFAKASNRLLEIAVKRFQSLGKTELSSSCIDIALANKAILSKTILPHEQCRKLITEADCILGDFHDATEIDFDHTEKLLNKAKNFIEKNTEMIPTLIFERLNDTYILARFKFCYKKSMSHKKQKFNLDAFVLLRQALSFLLSSSEKENNRFLAIVNHHLGLLKNLVEDETCNEYLHEAVMYYEIANMPESAEKVKATLYRIELNECIKEYPEEEKECCFLFWKSAIEKGDMAKFSFIHGYLKKNSQRIQIDSFKKLME